ncbi:MAG TPA: hypothetical protein VIJ94_20455 [Caulobacteraceae bacterium]
MDVGGGVYGFLTSEQPGAIGYRRSPSYLYQGFTANIDFPITQPPTKTGDGGALVFKITPNNTITPFQRGWFSNTGNFVEIGKAAFEACGLHYPYDFTGNIWSADSPCKDADYFDTPGWGNISVVATDITSRAAGTNAAIAIRKFGAHDEGLDIGYDPAGHGTLDRYGVHLGVRTAVEVFDPTTNTFSYPTKPAFQADLTSDKPAVTGHGEDYAVVFDAAQFDQGKNYDPATGRFTASVGGLYQLEVTVELSGVASTNRGFSLSLVTTSQTYHYHPGKLLADNQGRAGLHFSVLTRLNAGDTAFVTVRADGDARSVNVRGADPRTPVSTFSGFLVS